MGDSHHPIRSNTLGLCSESTPDKSAAPIREFDFYHQRSETDSHAVIPESKTCRYAQIEPDSCSSKEDRTCRYPRLVASHVFRPMHRDLDHTRKCKRERSRFDSFGVPDRTGRLDQQSAGMDVPVCADPTQGSLRPEEDRWSPWPDIRRGRVGPGEPVPATDLPCQAELGQHFPQAARPLNHIGEFAGQGPWPLVRPCFPEKQTVLRSMGSHSNRQTAQRMNTRSRPRPTIRKPTRTLLQVGKSGHPPP